MFYAPGVVHSAASMLLLPFSLLYGSGMFLRRQFAKRRSYPVPIVSVGNLTVGGTGKTPFVIELASRYEKSAVVSRGYGRRSSGLVEVSRWGRIDCSVAESGDEAMLMAEKLPESTVIVAENRHEGILHALSTGAKVILMDDGFNRVEIEKLEILLEPEKIVNRRVLPAGPFREFYSTAKKADLILKEGREYRRSVTCDGSSGTMMLAASIARPERLEPYLPDGVSGRYIVPVHAWFDENSLKRAMEGCGADTLLVTEKDLVKMKGFN